MPGPREYPVPGYTRPPGNVTKPYKFIGFGAMDVTKPHKFIGFGAMDVTKPYKFIGFGAIGPREYKRPGNTRDSGIHPEQKSSGSTIM